MKKRKDKNIRDKNKKAEFLVEAIATPRVEAETLIIDSHILEDQAGKQEKVIDINKVVENARRKASKAKIVVDKAIAELKSLRSKGGAFTEEIAAARKQVGSSIKKAAICETRVILAEDDLQAYP